GLVVTITTPRQAPSQGAFPQVQAQQPAADLNRLLRRAHDRYLAALREDFGYAEFKETQRRPVRVRGVPGVRSDYEYVLPHPIPLFNMRVRGYLITLPFSQTELIHFNAYCPPNSFGDYEKVYNQIIATIEVQAGGGAPFMGRWR
ncbi:MAG: hypothetical protein NZ556_04335, partial [Fimbriimonadales bacterium]|nr:hypothetical protein [Fimbriimonadales bacterium]